MSSFKMIRSIVKHHQIDKYATKSEYLCKKENKYVMK